MALLTRGLGVALVAMTVAGTAQAQTEWNIGIVGGWSVPTQSANDLYTAGYNIGGTIRVLPNNWPIGIQLDGAYHHFNRKELNTLDLGLNIKSLFLNAVFPVTFEASPLVPYLVGGVGLANLSVEDPRTIAPFETTTQVALDLGGGLEFRGWTSVFAPFIDVRLMGIFGSDPRETSYLMFNVGGKLVFGGPQKRGKKK